MDWEQIEGLEDEYRRTFDEGPPRFGLANQPERYAKLLRQALDRGSPITVREAYGDEVADGDAVA